MPDLESVFLGCQTYSNCLTRLLSSTPNKSSQFYTLFCPTISLSPPLWAGEILSLCFFCLFCPWHLYGQSSLFHWVQTSPRHKIPPLEITIAQLLKSSPVLIFLCSYHSGRDCLAWFDQCKYFSPMWQNQLLSFLPLDWEWFLDQVWFTPGLGLHPNHHNTYCQKQVNSSCCALGSLILKI